MTTGTILIVDDEKNVREGLAKVFRNGGYRVLMAANGEEALELHQAQRPDVVLLDLNMPVLNGWDAFERISTAHPLTPVIIITGRPDQFEIAAAARVGALMEKPLDVPVLLQTVHRLCHEPLAQRLSRLTFGEPMTDFFGSGSARPPNSPEEEIQAFRALRQQQLERLKFEAGG